MQLQCRSCGRPIPADDINIKLAIAKCGACHAVFSIADAAEANDRPVVGLPRRFRLENWGPELTITRSWYNHAVWFLLLFCIVWDGFLLFWYAAAASDVVGVNAGGMVWILLLFPIFHVAIGLFLTYFVLCTFCNTTVIRAGGGELSVRHGPLPWGGNCRVLTADVKQLFCVEKRHRRKRGYSYSYQVVVLKRDDTRQTLVSSLEELDQALFIEQQVEQHLKIAPMRVPGEVRV